MEIQRFEKRNYIIDLLKILACFLVFRIHMSEYFPPLAIAVPIFVFITSYNYTRSNYLHDTLTLKSCYSPKNLLKKFIRLYIPYIVFAVVQLILIFALKANYDVISIVISFFFGGYGPGNYYLLLMLQIILIFPLLLYFNRKQPNVTLIVCFLFYFAYHIIMLFVFPDNPEDKTTLGGSINKWTVFRWIFLIDCGIYFFIKRDKIKWWQLLLLLPLDLIPLIIKLTTGHPTLYIRKIPYHFITISLVGLCIKYLSNISFGKLNCLISYCGKATWHIFLFQQFYFWLIDLLNWQFGFTYISFPICFLGGIIFYSAHVLVVHIIGLLKNNPCNAPKKP